MATIKIIEGQPEGASIEVSQNIITLGRSPDSGLCIHDAKASRKHAQISINPAGTYELMDVGSNNGTIYKGNKIPANTPYQLSNGDEIVIGNTRLLFNCEESASRKPAPAGGANFLVDDSALSLQMGADDDSQSINCTLDAGAINILGAVGDEEGAETIKRLQSMVEVANELGEVFNQKQLLHKIMDKIFDIFPQADRSFIMTRSKDGVMEPAISRDSNPDEDQKNKFAISSTIIGSVVEKKQSILSNDAASDFGAQQSIMDLSIRSMMCAPLLYKGEIIGVINVDTMSAEEAFDEDDLTMLTGIAAQAATAIANSRLVEQIETETKKSSELSRYMSPDVAKGVADGSISAELGGKTAHGTVLFCDVVGFTTMSENVLPVELMDILNRSFKGTTDIIARHKGTINKFGGDMVMAFWNVMFPDDTPEINSLKASLQLQASVWYLNLDLIAEGKKPIYMGLGLNTGDFAAGNIGGERIEYTVIGDNINLAQRVESQAGRWQIFAAESTYTPAKDMCVAVKLPPVMLKGKTEPVQIYSIRGIRDGKNKLLLNIPVQIYDINGKALGEGLITGCTGEKEKGRISFSTLYEVETDQDVVLEFDMPEYCKDLKITGFVEDINRTTHYGEVAFSKSILGNISGDKEVLDFLMAGCLVETTKGWDEITRK